jgi:superfamily II DNA or RNA helicase
MCKELNRFKALLSTVAGARPLDHKLERGQILEGDLFSEPMRIVEVDAQDSDVCTLGLVGLVTERFRSVRLTREQLERLTVKSTFPSYAGDGVRLRLGIQAYTLGIAYEFDPYFGLSISKVDPLPHQLEAVYEHILRLPTIRFLLADDAGAGKTIMAGLLLKELKLRGLVERTIVVCPAALTFLWQRELREKFGEQFYRVRGDDLRAQYGVNPWKQHSQVITSLDLARKTDVLPGLRQIKWDLIIVDEAHRMSATAQDNKTLRYRLGELLRDSTDHMLLLTATPHRGDPDNFSLFLQLLDPDAFADVRSIREAMAQRRAPFYIRRLKEAMVYFPERQPDGSWLAKKIFTQRIPRTVRFNIEGSEYELYRAVTRFVKAQSARAAAAEEKDPRARALGFLMALFQRRLASSTWAMKRSLERRADLQQRKLERASDLAADPALEIPDEEDLDEMDDAERGYWEERLETISFALNAAQVRQEIEELRLLAKQADEVIQAGSEAKLSRLRSILEQEGFYQHRDQRLLIFTEFKETLDYLVEKLQTWGFSVGFIHGGMKPGSRDEPGTRLFSEQQFWDGATQILVATEAAGEGINLQCCHIMMNYDIPWNPNRLEQRMGRIHRYGQKKDCLIFNFVAANTVEGHVLERLLHKLQEIRDALEDDTVFNVVGEILPASYIERVLHDYYSGKLGDQDLEERFLRNVNTERFREICQNALEGLATRSLNLAMLVERRAKAQERRLVPETIGRFMKEGGDVSGLALRMITNFPHTFEPGVTPLDLRKHELDPDWSQGPLSRKYSRFSTDRRVAEENNLEWMTPGHPLFVALRRNILEIARSSFAEGGCFYSVAHDKPVRVDIYRARVVDGLGHMVHERLFAVELADGREPCLRDPWMLGNLQPAKTSAELPPIAKLPEARLYLDKEALTPFLDEVRTERVSETERVARHVEIALTELIGKEDVKIGRLTEEKERGTEGAAGLLAQAESRQAEYLNRREKRRLELARQSQLTLQNVERLTSFLILPHPEIQRSEVRNLRPDPEVEAIAMHEAILYEQNAGRRVEDVHEKDVGYDLSSVDLTSGELRLIEVKGFSRPEGTVLLTPNEYRVAQDRRDCYWLYVITDCRSENPRIYAQKDPASYPWEPVQKIEHYILSISQLNGS